MTAVQQSKQCLPWDTADIDINAQRRDMRLRLRAGAGAEHEEGVGIGRAQKGHCTKKVLKLLLMYRKRSALKLPPYRTLASRGRLTIYRHHWYAMLIRGAQSLGEVDEHTYRKGKHMLLTNRKVHTFIGLGGSSSSNTSQSTTKKSCLNRLNV